MDIEEIQKLVSLRKTLLAQKFPKFNSSHEGFAVIKLYAGKLWGTVEKQPVPGAHFVLGTQKQAGDVGAAALIFLESVCGASNVLELAVAELTAAEEKFDPFNSMLEGYAVLLEEIDELWDVVKLNPKKIEVTEETSDVPAWQKEQRDKMLREEAIQVAAMSLRFIKCLKDEPVKVEEVNNG